MCLQAHLCLFRYVHVCVHECICNRRSTVGQSKLFQLWSQSSVSVNQDSTSGPVFSRHHVSLLSPSWVCGHVCVWLIWSDLFPYFLTFRYNLIQDLTATVEVWRTACEEYFCKHTVGIHGVTSDFFLAYTLN